MGGGAPLAWLTAALAAVIYLPVVAPACEISILRGVVFGSRLLAEGDTARRLRASTMMLVGLALIAAR